MPTVLTHTAIGAACGWICKDEDKPLMFMTASAVCSVFPDLDLFGYYAGIPENSIPGQNELLHSPIAAFVVAALLAGLLFRKGSIYSWGTLRNFLYFFLLISLQGLLDGMVAGGPGVAYLAPFISTKFTLPWAPFHSSPFGIKFMFTDWGWAALKSELIYIWPVLAAGVVAKFFIGYLGSRSTAIVKAE